MKIMINQDKWYGEFMGDQVWTCTKNWIKTTKFVGRTAYWYMGAFVKMWKYFLMEYYSSV